MKTRHLSEVIAQIEIVRNLLWNAEHGRLTNRTDTVENLAATLKELQAEKRALVRKAVDEEIDRWL